MEKPVCYQKKRDYLWNANILKAKRLMASQNWIADKLEVVIDPKV